MIEAYCKQFFGYGRWEAPVWLIGLEEAGAGTPEELHARLTAWDGHGRRELEDAPSFYPACGVHRWHGPNARAQPTWRQLIRLLLRAQGKPVSEAALLEYQARSLGACSGHECLAELSPLPAPSQSQWPYADNGSLPQWVRRWEEFRQTVLHGRFATLREKIDLHRPRVVVFYFWKERFPAEEVAGGSFQPIIPERLLGLERVDTTYFITGHPAGGYPDSYFDELGQHFYQHYRALFAPSKATPHKLAPPR